MKCPKDYENWIGREVQMAVDAGNPDWYPKVNTVGTIVRTNKCTVLVNWGKESGVGKNYEGKYEWYVAWNQITPVNFYMTDEEIWEMLKPKMEKLEINYDGTYIRYRSILDEPKNYMDIPTVQKLVATAYRSGYGRGQKGRPFKIGEKKKKGGHWEPVDIEQVLKGDCKVVEDCLGWRYEYLGTYKKGEDGKFYQWVEDDE